MVGGKNDLGQEDRGGSSAIDGLYAMKQHTLKTSGCTVRKCDLDLNKASNILNMNEIKPNRAEVQSK